MNQYKTALSEFIKQDILHGRAVPLDDTQDLLTAGILDSLGILKMVSFIEGRFGIKVPDEDVVFENFQNIQVMAEYIAQRGKAPQSPASL